MIDQDRPKVYIIPENFIDESRIMKGMFRTRNFIEGVILAVVTGLIAWIIPLPELTHKIMLTIAFAGPFFLIGCTGFNGDPLSTTIMNARKWKKEGTIMLYNSSIKPLKKAPLEAMLEKELPKDKLINIVESVKESQNKKTEDTDYIEGKNFEFMEDKDISDIVMKREKAEVVDLVYEEPKEENAIANSVTSYTVTTIKEGRSETVDVLDIVIQEDDEFEIDELDISL